MAFVIANELGVNLKQTSGPVIEKAGDLVAILNDLEPGMFSLLMRSTVFLCRLKKCFTAPWKILYRHYDWRWREQPECPSGPSSFHFDWGDDASGYVSNPLRARFGITGHMEYYEQDDLTESVERTAEIFEMEITHEAAEELSLRSRGTPRLPTVCSNGCVILQDYGRWLD